MTICIAAICDTNAANGAKIVFCADRLVSAGIQFEGGTPKIKKLSDNCYAMYTSNDSLSCDLILQRTYEKLQNKEYASVRGVAEIVAAECVTLRNEVIDKTILWKYNHVIEKTGGTPDTSLNMAIEEVQNYQYELDCNFIILGIEQPNSAYLYLVDQDGKMKLADDMGFAIVGSGSGLALLELSKYPYSPQTFMTESLARVHFAKKLAERAQGVGRITDLRILWFYEDPKTKTRMPTVFDLLEVRPDVIRELDRSFEEIREYEQEKVSSLPTLILNMFSTNKPSEQKSTQGTQ